MDTLVIIDLLKNNANDYDLGGVEFVGEDAQTVRNFMKKGEPLDKAISLTLLGIAECLSD